MTAAEVARLPGSTNLQPSLDSVNWVYQRLRHGSGCSSSTYVPRLPHQVASEQCITCGLGHALHHTLEAIWCGVAVSLLYL